jgi:capsular polysaccharide export protein
MYSPLHEKIANITAKKKYAIASSLAMKVYLPSFKFTLATTIIKKNKQIITNELLSKISKVESYHAAYVKKIEGRNLKADELEYMAAYYLGLKQFIKEKEIDLVLIHNDTRWYHAIAVMLCKELNIKYLVTEQGLIRPSTTVIDNQGINFKSTLPTGLPFESNKEFIAKHPHDSLISMGMFGLFIAFFMMEKILKTQLKYFHNDYSFIKYCKRITHKFKKKQNAENEKYLAENSVLLLLQLELDSQLLIYSEFTNNQELISKLECKCKEKGLQLVIKKHPLDSNTYQVGKDTIFVDGIINKLSKQAKMVFTVNSSAALQVMKTSTPLYLLGDSVYDKQYVATKVDINNLDFSALDKIETKKDYRDNFLKLINNNYLLHGAGFSFNNELLEAKLKELLSEPVNSCG